MERKSKKMPFHRLLLSKGRGYKAFIFEGMGSAAKFVRILYQGYLSFLLGLPLLLLYPYYRFLLRKGHFDKVYRSNRRLALFFSKLSMIPISVHRDELPEPPYIVCANHSSYLDILYLMAPFPERFVFLGKGEILDWPYFSMFFRSMNIPVPRHSHRKAHEALLKAGEELDKNVPVAIFPEGTIPSEAPQLGNFKNGAFKLAQEKQVPIVPVTFLDHWRIFPEGEGFWGSVRPGRSRIAVHAPIEPEGKDLEELKAATRDSILQGWRDGNS